MLRLMCVTAQSRRRRPRTLALATAGIGVRGVETCVVCLTPGQAGSHRGGAQSDHELAELRRKDSPASCQILESVARRDSRLSRWQMHRQDLSRVGVRRNQVSPGISSARDARSGPEGA